MLDIGSTGIEHMNPPSPAAPDEDWIAWANGWPTTRALGMHCVRLDRAGARFEVAADPFVPNPNGSINGGILAAIVDQALGAVTARGVAEGMSPRTGSLYVQYHKPARPPVSVVATALSGGRRVQFVDVVVENGDETRCVSAQGTMVVVPVSGSGAPGQQWHDGE